MRIRLAPNRAQLAVLMAGLAWWSAGCQPVSTLPAPTPSVTAGPVATAAATASIATPAPATVVAEPSATATIPLPTATVLPTATLGPQLEINHVGSRVADDGTAHIAGEVHNPGTRPVSAVALRLVLAGQAPIDFAPLLDTIGAGRTAPFDVALPPGVTPPGLPTITVTGYSLAPIDTVSVTVQARPVDPGDGQIYLNGQLNNDDTGPVRVYGLAAAALDASGAVLAAGHDATLVHYLAPGMRVPFSIILPGGSQDGAWAVYLDARPSPTITATLTATVTNVYLDECGCLRLAGLVNNPSAQPLLGPLVAAVYDAQGSLLQMQAISATLPVTSGAPLPFGFSFDASISSNIALTRTAVALDLAGVRPPDPGAAVPLPTAVLSVTPSQWELNFDGQITNSTSVTLAGIDVLAAAYDQHGRLTAVQRLSVGPSDGGALAPGDALPLSFPILLDGKTNPNRLRLVLLAQGRLR